MMDWTISDSSCRNVFINVDMQTEGRLDVLRLIAIAYIGSLLDCDAVPRAKSDFLLLQLHSITNLLCRKSTSSLIKMPITDVFRSIASRPRSSTKGPLDADE